MLIGNIYVLLLLLFFFLSHDSYKNVVDGIRRVTVEGMMIKLMQPIRDSRCTEKYYVLFLLFCYIIEGFFKLWRGASLNVLRAVLMTLSQVSFK